MSDSNTCKKVKGPLIDPALCRCCRSIKRCRLLTTEYDYMGSKEIYSEMFMDVFGLLLTHLDGDSKDNAICATCVSRLREASAFRQQVLQSEQVFIESLQNRDEMDNIKLEIKLEPSNEEYTQDGERAISHDTYGMKLNDQMEVSDIEDTKELKNLRSGHKSKRFLIKLSSNSKIDKLLKKKARVKPSKRKRDQETVDQDVMALRNAVGVVTCSYVCPFHNRISFYYCYYCKDQFTNPDELREHTLTHDPGELFEMTIENKKIPKIDITRVDCRLCSDKIEDLETLKKHLSEVHDKVFYPVKNEFLKFRLTLTNLSCTECGSVFPYFDALKKHMTDHFGTFTCDICGACFLEQASLRTHIKNHSKVDANFPCEVCGKNLKSKYSRGLHVATVHEKKPTVNCYKCDSSFLSYALRNKHLIEVHGDERTFPCKLCDKVYNRRKTLMEHNRRNHLKVYRHQCELCDQRFYLPSRLKEHMATHTGERNFKCQYCDKSYPRLQSLQEHARTHNSERKHKCGVCESSFTQHGSLKNHMKMQHQVFDIDASFN